jgi:hypothetical protein
VETQSFRNTRAPLLLTLWVLGCGTSPAPSEEPQGVDVSDLTYTPCDQSQRVGQFTVELGDGFTAVQGRALNGVVPANVRKVEAQEGACRLLRGRSLFCSPSCGASQTCGESGTCIPYPTAQDLGTVRMLGLKAELSMSPNSAKFYSNGATTLPHPGFDPGTGIQLEASGGAVQAFTLRGQGVSALEVPEQGLPLERGKPATVTWTPSSASAAARIHLAVDLAHHGGIAASLECDGVADTGSFVLPSGLVSQLLDIGVAGFPKITLSRRSADSTNTSAGCVDLLVLSQVVRDVIIPGLVSCSSDADCPTGKTCQADLTCQ